jgi:hypothetical protein
MNYWHFGFSDKKILAEAQAVHRLNYFREQPGSYMKLRHG